MLEIGAGLGFQTLNGKPSRVSPFPPARSSTVACLRLLPRGTQVPIRFLRRAVRRFLAGLSFWRLCFLFSMTSFSSASISAPTDVLLFPSDNCIPWRPAAITAVSRALQPSSAHPASELVQIGNGVYFNLWLLLLLCPLLGSLVSSNCLAGLIAPNFESSATHGCRGAVVIGIIQTLILLLECLILIFAFPNAELFFNVALFLQITFHKLH